jgi:hypothetical protein
MSGIVVGIGPATPDTILPSRDLAWFRMAFKGNVCRFDILVGLEQRVVALIGERYCPLPGEKLGTSRLPEPSAMDSISVQIDRVELAAKLRALASELEGLGG